MAHPDLELRGEGHWFTCPTGLSPFCHFFFVLPKIRWKPPGPCPRFTTELDHYLTGFKFNYQFYPNASLLHRKNSGIQTQAVLQTPFGPSTMEVSVLQGYRQMAPVSLLTHTFCQLRSSQTSMAMDQKKNLLLSPIFILKIKGEKLKLNS